MIDIRPASAGEDVALAECHATCWREAYAGLLSEERFVAMDRRLPARIEWWTRMINSNSPPQVALADGTVIGFADAGPPRDNDLDLDHELYAIYVRKAYWDTGVGHRLLIATLGDHPASVWVFAANDRARRFYRRHGFLEDGTEKPEPTSGFPEIRMIRASSVEKTT